MSSTTENIGKAAEALQAVAKPLIALVTLLLPVVVNVTAMLWKFYKTLPANVVKFLIGAIFTFFGGMYPTVFAAVQAAEHGGRSAVVEALQDLSEEAMIIIEASKKDDEVDADKDGKADVKQMDNKGLMMRKFNLVVTKMNPEKVDKGIASLYRVWLAVLAVLTIQFARVISMALTIADFMKRPIDRFITPTVLKATPQEYKKWVPVVTGWIVKAIAISFAWYIQTIISAFTSALAGGLLMSRAIYDYCVYRDISLGGMIKPDSTDSVFDEGLSYIFAALGFYFQFKLGFNMPFPFNVLLFPIEFAEYYIRWTITKVT